VLQIHIIPIEDYHHFRGTFCTEDGGTGFLQNISMQLWVYLLSRGIVPQMKMPKLSSMLFQVERNSFTFIHAEWNHE
jgi:hypothetical protein